MHTHTHNRCFYPLILFTKNDYGYLQEQENQKTLHHPPVEDCPQFLTNTRRLRQFLAGFEPNSFFSRHVKDYQRAPYAFEANEQFDWRHIESAAVHVYNGATRPFLQVSTEGTKHGRSRTCADLHRETCLTIELIAFGRRILLSVRLVRHLHLPPQAYISNYSNKIDL